MPVQREKRDSKGRRRSQRGTATVETLYVTLAFSVPLLAMVVAWGPEAYQQYKDAREYMMRSYP
jgi:hypothetical protein